MAFSAKKITVGSSNYKLSLKKTTLPKNAVVFNFFFKNIVCTYYFYLKNKVLRKKMR